MAERRRTVGNLLALAVLAYLTQGPMHPYELGRTLQHNGDARSIKYRHASLYMVVEQLAKAGLVVPVRSVKDGARPERTVYALTDAGRLELNDWLRDLLARPQHEHPQFVAALSLVAALPPDDVVELLGRRLDGLSEQRVEIESVMRQAAEAGVPALFLVEEEYRLAVLDAEVEFCRRFRDRITDPATGWRAAWSPDPATTAAGVAR
jgi:DNA-binding PadR family transcriptional regulator